MGEPKFNRDIGWWDRSTPELSVGKVESHGPHVASYRTTKYEVRRITIGPNEFGLECCERETYGSPVVPLVIHESHFTPKQMKAFQEAMSLLEEAFRVEHDAREDALKLSGLDVPRAEVHKLVKVAEEAKLEAARLKVENEAKQAELRATEAAIEKLKGK